MSTYIERALFVIAPQNFGKSTLLRSMFNDPRLGNNGDIPTSRKLRDVVRLSGERRLYLRLTSPHEAGETLGKFIEKTKGKMDDGRWCFAGPLHPSPLKNMPTAASAIQKFITTFDPERVRAVLLWPSHNPDDDDVFDSYTVEELLGALQKIDKRVETVCVDGRQRGRNGLVLADFFDFT